MNTTLRFRLVVLLLCVSLIVVAIPAEGDDGALAPAVASIVAIAAVGALIGIGVYVLARKAQSLTGCVSGGTGLLLQNESDQQTYALIGDIAQIKAGDRTRVSGKKKKKTGSGQRDFFVEKVAKDYGPCKVVAAPSP